MKSQGSRVPALFLFLGQLLVLYMLLCVEPPYSQQAFLELPIGVYHHDFIVMFPKLSFEHEKGRREIG